MAIEILSYNFKNPIQSSSEPQIPKDDISVEKQEEILFDSRWLEDAGDDSESDSNHQSDPYTSKFFSI